jgi:hypothetical protein
MRPMPGKPRIRQRELAHDCRIWRLYDELRREKRSSGILDKAITIFGLVWNPGGTGNYDSSIRWRWIALPPVRAACPRSPCGRIAPLRFAICTAAHPALHPGVLRAALRSWPRAEPRSVKPIPHSAGKHAGWGATEFGRTPGGEGANGRDHNPLAVLNLDDGAGIKKESYTSDR